MTVSSVLITGSNVGLGFECAKQLAAKENITRIILACRNPTKAEDAKTELETITGKKDVFETLIVDVSNLESVKTAVESLKGTTLDGLVLNAGGVGGTDPSEITEYGVTNIMAANVLGHVYMVDLLLEKKILNADDGGGASVVYSGTEASRGVELLGMKKPVLSSGSVEEFTSICDGSFFGDDDGDGDGGNRKANFEGMYGVTKLVATLWMSSMAHQPSKKLRFVTVSPGGTTGTTFARDMPWYQKWAFAILMPVMELFGKMHSIEVGAKRYVDALLLEDEYKSGIFYASKAGVSGEVADQVIHFDVFGNESY